MGSLALRKGKLTLCCFPDFSVKSVPTVQLGSLQGYCCRKRHCIWRPSNWMPLTVGCSVFANRRMLAGCAGMKKWLWRNGIGEDPNSPTAAVQALAHVQTCCLIFPCWLQNGSMGCIRHTGWLLASNILILLLLYRLLEDRLFNDPQGQIKFMSFTKWGIQTQSFRDMACWTPSSIPKNHCTITCQCCAIPRPCPQQLGCFTRPRGGAALASDGFVRSFVFFTV